MRLHLFSLFILCNTLVIAQSEQLIPSDAATILSINNVNLLQKVSLDTLIEYDFMDEIHNEIFDGSAEGKTLKQTGFDFDQRLNIYHGYTKDYEIAGFTFGIKSKKELFEIFDDFSPAKNNKHDIEIYESFLSKIAIVENSGILYRLTPHYYLVDQMTDSIWQARGNSLPWFNFDFIEEYEDQEAFEIDSIITQEFTPNNTEDYYDLRDSIELSLHHKMAEDFEETYFSDSKKLVNSQPAFLQSLDTESDANIFIDNTRNIQSAPFGSYTTLIDNVMIPLYTENIITGKMQVIENEVILDLNASYGTELGEIYTDLTDVKWDINLFKFIHENDPAFLTFRLNTEAAYNKAYEILIPELEKSSSRKSKTQLLMIDLIDIVINKEPFFNAYNGSAFISYKGIKEINTTSTVTDYNQEDFTTTERIVENKEGVPVFAIGFSCGEKESIERILKRISDIEKKVSFTGDYWTVQDGMIRSVDVYLLITDDHFIITNDEDLVKNHTDGFGDNSIQSTSSKSIKKSGVLYAHADLNKVTSDLPKEMFNHHENELLDIIREKNGTLEISSSSTGNSNTSFSVHYDTNEDKNSLKYILDLINSLYVSQAK